MAKNLLPDKEAGFVPGFRGEYALTLSRTQGRERSDASEFPHEVARQDRRAAG
jgi:hypothetical protein